MQNAKREIKPENVWIFIKELDLEALTPEIGWNSPENSKKSAFYPLNIFSEYGMIIFVTVQYSS